MNGAELGHEDERRMVRFSTAIPDLFCCACFFCYFGKLSIPVFHVCLEIVKNLAQRFE
jgi:hypothetical protein